MRRFISLIIVLCGTCVCIWAHGHIDTLRTVTGDTLILMYDVESDSNQLQISFVNSRIKLGELNSRKIKNVEDVKVVLFDRTGVYSDISFTNITPEALMTPSQMRYARSEAGYFFIEERPTLTFVRETNKASSLYIPLYFAIKENRDRYKLFSVCREFEVKVDEAKVEPQMKMIERVDYEADEPTAESEEQDGIEVVVTSQINTVLALLDAQQRLPFSDGLQYEINKLRDYRDRTSDKVLLSRINRTLTKCEVKKLDLENAEIQQQAQAEKEAAELAKAEREREQQLLQEQEQIRRQEAEATKKRNIWTIIGGAILAVLCFVGSQISQHIRSVKNQRSLAQMQDNLTRQAENRVKNIARSQVNKTVGDVKRKVRQTGREMLQKKTFPNKKGPGNFSI